MKNRPNTTQRSWSDYTGDKKIKAWEEKGFYDGRSPQPMPNYSEPDPEEEINYRRKQSFSRLRAAMENL
jgi:hypothetical protein